MQVSGEPAARLGGPAAPTGKRALNLDSRGSLGQFRWGGWLAGLASPAPGPPFLLADQGEPVPQRGIRSRDDKPKVMFLTRRASSCTANHDFWPFLARSVPTLFPFFASDSV